MLILENMKPKQVGLVEWINWMGNADRRIDCTEIGSVKISTVFIGLVMADPQLFETMVFGGPLDGDSRRYRTLGEAKQGHHDLVEKVKNERIKNGQI